METLRKDVVEIVTGLQDRPMEELVTYDLKRDWRREEAEDPWRLMCLYKKDKSPAGDCDVSLRSMVIYWLAFGFADWRLCPDGRGNFQLEKEGAGYAVRGDTMNSYATTAHAYFRMKGLEKGKGTWHDAILEDYGRFAPLYCGPFADFVNVCHTVGNMLPIPSGDLNRARGIGPTKDYFDLYITWLFEYIGEVVQRHGDRLIRGVSFTSELFPGVGELIEFLGSYKSWDAYVRANHLEGFCQSYVENGVTHFTEGLPLWKGHRFSRGALPRNTAECEDYFKNASERILARGRQIITAVKKTLADYERQGHTPETLADRLLDTQKKTQKGESV